MLGDGAVERALVVTAHPDDVDFGAGGTVASWVEAGTAVTYCVITDGDAGGFDPTVPRSAIPGIRRAEQEAAAKVLGVEEVVFLGYPDGQLTVTIELRRDLSRVIRQVRPQRLLTQSPQRSFDRIYASHPDHLAAGEAALCAVYPDARNAFAHVDLLGREDLEPWAVGEVWLMGGPEPDRFVDVTATFDRKLEAILAHESQVTDPPAMVERIRAWQADQAHHARLPAGHLAESFRVLDTA
jgi:LmbE family N-acetylglucosaminyl deacetylase